jgi:UDP-N-acetylmuramate dehydrogenase
MVIDPDDPNRHSAGSFFKNPIVSAVEFERIREPFDEPIPHFPVGEAQVKIPAAWLIEHSGFYRGFALRNAGISTRHTLAIINRGGATAAEIVVLKNTIQNAVLERFGIALVPEPVFVGDFTAKN